MNRLGRLAIQLTAIIVFWSVLTYFNLFQWYVILPIALFLLLYLVFKMRIADNEIYFEIMCNTTLYLRRLEQGKDAKRDTDLYHLGLAYAAIYQDDIERAAVELERVDEANLTSPPRHLPILLRVRARVAAHEKDRPALDGLRDRIQEFELPQLLAYVEALRLEQQEQWQELVTHIETWMPSETVRLHLIELERLLAIAYLKLDRTEDAKAVLSATVKRGCGTYHTDWAYETYIGLTENE